jgi:hypothetical protein
MAEAVYLLCAATSFACALLLLRAYFRQGTRLLLWSGLCFALLALNNMLLFVDLIIIPTAVDLSIWRSIIALGAIGVLLYVLIWESR